MLSIFYVKHQSFTQQEGFLINLHSTAKASRKFLFAQLSSFERLCLSKRN